MINENIDIEAIVASSPSRSGQSQVGVTSGVVLSKSGRMSDTKDMKKTHFLVYCENILWYNYPRILKRYSCTRVLTVTLTACHSRNTFENSAKHYEEYSKCRMEKLISLDNVLGVWIIKYYCNILILTYSLRCPISTNQLTIKQNKVT